MFWVLFSAYWSRVQTVQELVNKYTLMKSFDMVTAQETSYYLNKEVFLRFYDTENNWTVILNPPFN